MSNPLRILLVEEDPDVAILIRTLLGQAGHTVATVAFGIEALSRTGAADVVLIDSVLPDMSGIEVVRSIRLSGSAVPVVLIAGQADRLWGGGADPPEGCTAIVAKSKLIADLLEVVVRAESAA